jgi:Rrf2 family protein
MRLLNDKDYLGIAVVVAVAKLGQETLGQGLLSGRKFAEAQGVPPRHMEGVLQELVHIGVLKGVRGPKGGYKLGRSADKITVFQIIEAVRSLSQAKEVADLGERVMGSPIVVDIVAPAIEMQAQGFIERMQGLKISMLLPRVKTDLPETV